MRKLLLAAMLLSASPAMAAVTITVLPPGPIGEDHTDLFDVSQGSTFIGGTGGYPTIAESDLLGGVTATSIEPGSYVFNDFSYADGVQKFGFKTAAPVTIAGFNVFLGGDASGARQFDFMSLSASTDNITFSLLDSFTLTSDTYLNAYGANSIRVQSLFAAGTYQYFRLAAHDRHAFEGGRILELDAIAGNLVPPGVPEPAAWAMMVLGFGVMGHAMRRRRGAADQAACLTV